jgi:hypothetical protein
MEELPLPVGTRVRVTRAVDGAHAGAEGVVIGYYRRDPPAYAVAIAEHGLPVPPDCLERVDERDE